MPRKPPTASDLVAYLAGEAAGWCAVEPRTVYRHLLLSRVPWAGRDEDAARAMGGNPMIIRPGEEMTWGELDVGSIGIFAAAGFTEASRPTVRRVVTRVDLDGRVDVDKR